MAAKKGETKAVSLAVLMAEPTELRWAEMMVAMLDKQMADCLVDK